MTRTEVIIVIAKKAAIETTIIYGIDTNTHIQGNIFKKTITTTILVILMNDRLNEIRKINKTKKNKISKILNLIQSRKKYSYS